MNVDQFLKQIVFMARNFGDCDIRDIVKLCLMDIDMPTDHDGFKYLICGIAFLYNNPDAMVTKHIYPAIAGEFGCQSTHVEIAIRRVIAATRKRRSEKWFNYFPEYRKITNGEFMSTMAQVLTFWDSCRKNLTTEGVGERD